MVNVSSMSRFRIRTLGEEGRRVSLVRGGGIGIDVYRMRFSIGVNGIFQGERILVEFVFLIFFGVQYSLGEYSQCSVVIVSGQVQDKGLQRGGFCRGIGERFGLRVCQRRCFKNGQQRVLCTERGLRCIECGFFFSIGISFGFVILFFLVSSFVVTMILSSCSLKLRFVVLRVQGQMLYMWF